MRQVKGCPTAPYEVSYVPYFKGVPAATIADWLAAKREVLWAPPLELTETDTDFRIRMAAPGFDASEIEVAAFPQAIMVHAESMEDAAREGELRISEWTSARLYRRLDLPSAIDLDRVTASLDRGILNVKAAKAGPVKRAKLHASGKAA